MDCTAALVDKGPVVEGRHRFGDTENTTVDFVADNCCRWAVRN